MHLWTISWIPTCPKVYFFCAVQILVCLHEVLQAHNTGESCSFVIRQLVWQMSYWITLLVPFVFENLNVYIRVFSLSVKLKHIVRICICVPSISIPYIGLEDFLPETSNLSLAQIYLLCIFKYYYFSICSKLEWRRVINMLDTLNLSFQSLFFYDSYLFIFLLYVLWVPQISF